MQCPSQTNEHLLGRLYTFSLLEVLKENSFEVSYHRVQLLGLQMEFPNECGNKICFFISHFAFAWLLTNTDQLLLAILQPPGLIAI